MLSRYHLALPGPRSPRPQRVRSIAVSDHTAVTGLPVKASRRDSLSTSSAPEPSSPLVSLPVSTTPGSLVGPVFGYSFLHCAIVTHGSCILHLTQTVPCYSNKCQDGQDFLTIFENIVRYRKSSMKPVVLFLPNLLTIMGVTGTLGMSKVCRRL